MAERLSVPLAELSLEDRFRTKDPQKENAPEKETPITTGKCNYVEVLEIDQVTKENNNSDETDGKPLPKNNQSASPLLQSSYHPSMDFAGTINYIWYVIQ